MEDLFARLVLGHLIGDYLLQPKWMALLKSSPGRRGALCCLVHCIIYTGAVCLELWTISPLIIGVVFLSHYPIDRWSLASRWLKLIGGRDFLAAHASKDPYREIHICFSTIVYTVVDNGWHLLLLYHIIGKFCL